MKTITLTENKFYESAIEATLDLTKDDPNFRLTLMLAYMVLMNKLFKDKDSKYKDSKYKDTQEEVKKYENRITLSEFLHSKDKLAIHCKNDYKSDAFIKAHQMSDVKKDVGVVAKYDFSTNELIFYFINDETISSLDELANSKAKIYEFDEVDLNE